MSKYQKKLVTRVSPQTFFNLRILAAEAGYDDVGKVIDKMTRSHMLSRSVGPKEYSCNMSTGPSYKIPPPENTGTPSRHRKPNPNPNFVPPPTYGVKHEK